MLKGFITVIIGLIIGLSPMFFPNAGQIEFSTIFPLLVISFITMLIGALRFYRGLDEGPSHYSGSSAPPPKKKEEMSEDEEHWIYYNLFLNKKDKRR